MEVKQKLWMTHCKMQNFNLKKKKSPLKYLQLSTDSQTSI